MAFHLTVGASRSAALAIASFLVGWRMKRAGDNYKQLISSQKQALEKTTYRWAIEPDVAGKPELHGDQAPRPVT